MRIYVSGPTVSSVHEEKSFPALIYRIIEARLSKQHEVDLPIRTEGLSKLSPLEFYNRVQKQIERADGIFTLLISGDQSTPIEAATAANQHKPQCVLAVSKVPRLIAGLPYVVEISPIEPEKDLEGQIDYLLDRLFDRLLPPKLTL